MAIGIKRLCAKICKAVSKPLSASDYPAFLNALKQRVLHARTSASRAVSKDLVLLYWDIGKGIVEKQQSAGWGNAVVERLGADLRRAFPEMRGFSVANLWRMKQLYQEHTTPEFLAQAARELKWMKKTVAVNSPEQSVVKSGKTGLQPALGNLAPLVRDLIAAVPWGHHVLLIGRIVDPAARLYYLRATAQFAWSRNILLTQMKAGAYERAVKEKKTHNFTLALPDHFAEQAEEMMKSRYNLEFLGISQPVKERDLEERLINCLQHFILELGYGFCFVGRQYRLALGRKEYFVDLLFYHRFLKSLVAFDLKIGSFEPEHAGKMDFYLNLLNDKERSEGDSPSIGIILCAEKDDVEVEFALKTKANPIGVAEYQLQDRLPSEFKGYLPTAKQLSDAVRESL